MGWYLDLTNTILVTLLIWSQDVIDYYFTEMESHVLSCESQIWSGVQEITWKKEWTTGKKREKLAQKRTKDEYLHGLILQIYIGTNKKQVVYSK